MTPESTPNNNSLPTTTKIEITPELLQSLIQQSKSQSDTEDEIDLSELWEGVVKRKGFIILFTILITLIMVISTFFMTSKFQSKVILMSVSSGDSNGGLMAKYGGLASLAGISLPSGGDISLSSEAIAILKSKRFLREYILEKELKKQIFYKNWDEANKRWFVEKSVFSVLKEQIGTFVKAESSALPFVYTGKEELAPGEPSIYSVVNFFITNVLSISEDQKTGLFTLKIEWINPVVAKEWANELVLRVDNELRKKAIDEAQATIDYMNKKLPSIELQDLRSIALQLIEENIKKITFAEVKKSYVFKVIDPAIVAEKPVSPKKGLLIAVSFILGLMLSIFIALVLNWRETKKLQMQSASLK